MILNPEQQACVDAIEGKYVVLAGPGSGKTSCVIQRFMNMLSKGIPSNDILNLTFTHAGASEMVRRSGFLDAENVFRTFHSFAIDLLKKERENLSFKVCDTIIPVEMQDYKLLFELTRQFPAINNFRMLREKLSEWKRNNVSSSEALDESRFKQTEYYYAKAYDEYEYRCREQGWLDFDSLIDETLILLETNEEVRNRWKRKYICVDEAQDCDDRQWQLLKLIFDGNILCVGDESQCVFEWRSARPNNLTNLAQRFPGAKTLYLGKNYRSTKQLVSFFQEIVPVDNGVASHMTTDNEDGIGPIITHYSDEVEEAEQVLADINDPVNTAIIARTNRQLFVYQRMCTVKKIKYRTLGKKDFWDQNEIKKLLDLAKQSQDMRPASVVLSDLIQRYDLINLYKNSVTIDSNPIENLNDIVKMSAGKGTIFEFLDYLRRLTGARRSVKGLTLSTVHQIKGREKNFVYVIGVNQEKMPHKDGELNEEKRIFFVACTRAAQRLNISYSGPMSMFLENYKDRIRKYMPAVEAKEEDGAPIHI